MDTTIGVRAATRDQLAQVKRETGAVSLDEVLANLLEGRLELERRRQSAALLASVSEKRAALARLCRDRGIRRLSIFGSTLHGEAGAESDLDLLAEFEPGRTPGLVTLGGIERALSQLLGHRVELNTPGSLSPEFRSGVLEEAHPVYGPP